MHGAHSNRLVTSALPRSTRGSVPAPKVRVPLVRLRVVLAVVLMGAFAAIFWPRGRAAWQLHNRATALADYSMCMVGPTGPELIRAGSAEYGVLLRRRVVSAPGDARPFQGCVRFAPALGLSPEVTAAHQLAAAEFDEFWDARGAGKASVAVVSVSLLQLSELVDRSWPFVREGHARLVVASSHTHEAPHATPPRPPGVGSGLPDRRSIFRSTALFGDRVVVALGAGERTLELTSEDGGVHFSPGSHGLASELGERCAVDLEGRGFTLSATGDGDRMVVSHGPGAAPHVARLAPKEQKLLSVVCDGRALVALLSSRAAAAADAELTARLCEFRGTCRDLVLPLLGNRQLKLPLDIARVEGDTIIAVATGGITRVASSRDQGATWTPFSVAFDRASLDRDWGGKTPFRLLSAGPRVLLYAGANRTDQAYYLLVSDDHGAGFHEPE